METEIEAKFLEVDKDSFMETLKKAGAKLIPVRTRDHIRNAKACGEAY